MATLTSAQKAEASKVLREFADKQLVPSEQYEKAGNLAAQDILIALKKGTDYIARHTTAGSMGKRTALGDETKPDFDLVVFCNGKEPPFTPVVQEFKKILQQPYASIGLKEAIKIEDDDEYKITVIYQGYSFDICPARHLGDGDGVTWIVQRQKTYTIITGTPAAQQQQVARQENTGLVDSSLRFVKDQDAFTHAVVRLAKYWSRFLDNVVGKLRGRSLMMETIAVDAALAALATKERDSELMLLAFSTFLQKMAKFNSINCFFIVNYNEEMIPAAVKSSRPLVLDPSSPFDNLAKNLTNAQIKIFEAAAAETLEKLGHVATAGGGGDADIAKKVEAAIKPHGTIKFMTK